MAEVIIKDVDPEILKILETRAERRGTSLEIEAKRILRDATTPGLPTARLTPEIERVRAMFQDRVYSDSAELLREARDQ